MSDQEVAYSTLRFLQSPSASQNRSRPRKTNDKVFQCIREKHQQQEIIGNLTQRYHIIQNDNYLKEQLLTNKTLEDDILKTETFQQTNRLCPFFTKKNRCKFYEDHWSCCGVDCYYFITENKNWKKCKQTCQSYKSSLLKIDDKDEQEFVQSQIYKRNYWIGLSYDEVESKWKWIADDTSGLNFTVMNLRSGRGECGFLTSTRISTIDCSMTYGCICEKRIDSVFSTSK
ncbi:Killer cell lectin-like receptor 2 [Tupaia chinensis]|uniref:Killer cell lectin-like receptor 2 n=1 Tax=Tupaia chinensis TaxID=246437 RepID=L8YBJ6_TUPCH|nr:Killer cell lectin-like receptor 2 [Tupaia chinensis]